MDFGHMPQDPQHMRQMAMMLEEHIVAARVAVYVKRP